MQSKRKQIQKSKTTRSPSENKNKLALVSKLSSAMKIKYRNLFFSIGYQDKELHSDINQFLTTKYQNKLPKEAFATVEEEILKKIKEKNIRIVEQRLLVSLPLWMEKIIVIISH